MAFIPRRARAVANIEHLRRGGAAGPVADNAGALQPYIAPEPVRRLLLHIHLQPGFGQIALEQRRHIDGAVEGGLRGLNGDCAGEAGLFQVELGLVRIMRDRLEGSVEVGVAARDRVVEADAAIAAHQGFNHLLAVNAVFHRQAQIVVFEHGAFVLHQRDHGVPAARGNDELITLFRLDQIGDLGIHAVDRVHLAGHQRVQARGAVVDHGEVERIEEATILAPVIRVAGALHAHAGLIAGDGERAGADRLAKIRRPFRHHAAMVIGEHGRELTVRGFQADGDLVVTGLFHVRDRREHAGRAGLGFAAMQVDRINRIIRGEGFAVVEGDTFLQVEHPFGRTGFGFPARGQTGLGGIAGAGFDQRLKEGEAAGGADRIVPGGRVQAIGGAATADAEAHGATAARRFGRMRVFGGDDDG